MYVNEKDLNTLNDLWSCAEGAAETADDTEYWGGLCRRAEKLFQKMAKANAAQYRNREMKKLKSAYKRKLNSH